MAHAGIPGFSDKRPPLGRLEQLVSNAEPSDPIISPTDYSFSQLLALRVQLENAAKYVPASELTRLQTLDERRNRLASQAFQTAQLPAALIAFEAKAHEHNLLEDMSEDTHANHYKTKLGGWGGFGITYKSQINGATRVDVSASRFIGSAAMLAFNYHPQPAEGKHRFELISADVRALKRSGELVELLDNTVKDIEEAKLRQYVRQHINQRYY